jgi:hypothetical protein
MVDWSGTAVNSTTEAALIVLCLLAQYFAYKAGFRWPWERADREQLLRDIESGNIALADAAVQRRMTRAEAELGRERVMSRLAEKRHKKVVADLEEKISDL